LFAIFTYGQRSCTKADFKQVLLDQLGMRRDISENDIEVFMKSN
jgi:hypothetical protein